MTTDHLYREREVLVTGAEEFFGARIVRSLLERGANVHCLLENQDPRSPLWLTGDIERVHAINGSVESFRTVKSALIDREIDTVLHLAGQPSTRAARRDPLATYERAVRGTYHVLEACRQAQETVDTIVLLSSDRVYGDADTLPSPESAPLRGTSPFEASCIAAEAIASSYVGTYRLPIAVARCSAIYGPGDFVWRRLIPGATRSLLRGEAPVILGDGAAVRDFLYVDDAALGVLALAIWCRGGTRENIAEATFNFASNRPMTMREMVGQLCTAVGREDLLPICRHAPIQGIPTLRPCAKRARKMLGWFPVHDLESSIAETVAWHRALRDRFDPPFVGDGSWARDTVPPQNIVMSEWSFR